MQLVVYRDYDSKLEGILESSPWEVNPKNLFKFMEKITATGGADYDEAIEVGIQHVL